MTKSYYDMLDVAADASADEIKRAFRREIAKYHPDKVQHLGHEFQSIAAVKAAELTQAYKTLSDSVLRAEYNAQLPSAAAPASAGKPAESTRRPTQQTTPSSVRQEEPRQPRRPEPPPRAEAPPVSQDRRGASDLVRKAAVMRFRQAMEAELGRFEEHSAAGLDVVAVTKPGFMSRKVPPFIAARFVPEVDGAAVTESWMMASRIRREGPRDICLFVMGPVLASARALATAIAEERRRPLQGGGQLILIPVNTRTWDAHVPNEAPPIVKALLTKLRAG